MTTIHNSTNKTEFDEDGFLISTQSWNETIAQNIAFIDGIGVLSQNHYSVIKQLREHFFKTGAVTANRVICHEAHLGPNCINTLFTSHGIEAWKIAGLPNPGEEAKTYM